jgi:hypothetical protein
VSERPTDQNDPPERVEVSEPSSVSAEFPAVTLGDSGESATPGRRLLQGRVHEAWALYPAYAMELVAGAIASLFALQSEEWSVAPVALTWFLLYLWVWFYGVAYRYRRRFFRYSSLFVLLSASTFVSSVCFDRAAAQVAFDGQRLVERAAEPTLVWAGVLTAAAGILVLVHVVFLGRGYRERKVAA